MSNAARLDFIVSLMDQVSGPANKMMKTMDTVTSNIQTGYQKIGYGVAGLFSVGYAFDKMLAPAKEMRTALGTISSLGVENSALEHLRKTSMATAVQYGSDATEIVNASYKLQSAISGLKGNELSMLANKSAMLATATKGGLESTNAYVGQMFNIHAVEADAIGKTAFMDKLISKTAKAVQLFNTDGTQMGEAMKNIGKQATAMKVPLEEQLAVMGFLQNTMVEGGRSGNAYSSFLANISKAETTLGMKFTDSQNKALPMVDIITKLQGKFGDLSKAGDQQMLQKAFGKRGQQVLAAMAGSLDTFKGNLESIKSVKGLDDVTAMAMAIADPWDQSAAAVKNFRMEFGERLLKVFSPVYDQITLTMTTLTKWMDMFPHLTGAVIKGVIGIGILVGSLSALSIVVGLSKFVMVGWVATTTLMKFALLPFGPLLTATKVGFAAMNLSIALGNGIMATAKFGLLGMLGSMKMMMLQSKLAAATIWIFNGGLSAMAAALWANPITWIVVGVIALTAAVVAAVVYWDTWTAKLGEWSTAFAEFIGVFDFVDGVLALWNKLPEWWASFKNYLSGMNVFSFVGDSIDWLIDKINMIPGINIDTTTDMPKPVAAPASLSNAAPKMAGGGLMNQISNATSNNNSRNVGDVHINNYGQAMSGQSLMDELAFAAP
jgi:TP901 family phage tail tape measure protein